jgi:hypothetical protein
LLRNALLTWHANVSGRILEDTLALRSQSRTMSIWKRRFVQVRVKLQGTLPFPSSLLSSLLVSCQAIWSDFLLIPPARAAEYQSHVDESRLKQAFAQWTRSLQSRQQDLAQAASLDRTHLVRQTFSRWSTALAATRQKEQTADVAHEFLLNRRAWSIWSFALTRRRQARWVQTREAALLKETFDRESIFPPFLGWRNNGADLRSFV